MAQGTKDKVKYGKEQWRRAEVRENKGHATTNKWLTQSEPVPMDPKKPEETRSRSGYMRRFGYTKRASEGHMNGVENIKSVGKSYERSRKCRCISESRTKGVGNAGAYRKVV